MPFRRSLLLALALLSLGLASCGSKADISAVPGPSTTSKPNGALPTGAWIEQAASPLAPRAHTVAVWTGKEVLLVGGDTFMCPASADCAGPTDPPFADGAAFDTASGTWRTIAPSPVAFSTASTAVLGDDAYFLVPATFGARAHGATFLRYSVADNAWTQLARPKSGGTLVAAGAAIIAYAGSDEQGEESDLVFDPAAASWRELPPDPLSPAFDRVMTWSGAYLYLFDHELVPNPGSEQPTLTRAARLDLESGTWEQLPDSEILGTGPWFQSGTSLVSPVLGSADGGEVNNWGRSYPFGGIFDTATATWSSLPAAPAGAGSAGVIGSGAGLYFASDGPLLDLDSNTWITLPPIPGHRSSDERTVVSAGADAFVFGGVRWAGDSGGALLDDAWIWHSDRTGDGGTVSEPFTETGGCGDAFFWAANATSTVAVTVSIEARDRSRTGPTVIDFTLPDARIKIEIQRGRGLVQPFCNDVVDGNVWHVDSRRAGEVGTGRITLAAAGADTYACGTTKGTLHLQDLVADDGTKLGAIDIATNSIGCYAG